MKRLLKIGLLLGLVVIVGLGGAVLYKVDVIKKQSQNKINVSLERYAKELEAMGMGLDFEPFVCEGTLSILCQSPRVEVLEAGKPLLRLSHPSLGLKDLDFKGMTLSLDASLAYLGEDDLRDYVQMLLPQKLHIISRFGFDETQRIRVRTQADLHAQNLNYDLVLDWNLKSSPHQGGILEHFNGLELNKEPIYLSGLNSKFVAKDLHPTLYAVAKKHYGKLSPKEFQALVALLVGVSSEQFSRSPNLQKVIEAVGEMALGKREELGIQVGAGDLCLTCPNGLEKVFQEMQVR